MGFMSPFSVLLGELRQGSAVQGIKSAAIALLLQTHHFPPDQTQSDNLRLFKDSCRVEALACVPAITWTSREWSVAHVVTLTLFSFTWCLHSFLIEMASRWNHLAEMVWSDMRDADVAVPVEQSLKSRQVMHLIFPIISALTRDRLTLIISLQALYKP